MLKRKNGSPEPDSFDGKNQNDVYNGLAGMDSINGNGGSDKLKGGDDNDSVLGGKGNDKIWGDQGYDTLSGDEGKDMLWGGTETDSFLFKQGGQFGIGSDVDIIKDIDTKGDDMDHIYIMSMDFTDQIDSFSDVMKHAKQDGKDVKIDFGHGDVLILEHVKKAALTADLFMFDG